MIEADERPRPMYLNRELSWLDFNRRVLAQAEDRDLPLLDRLKFCAIYASNLDEFFMVRVAGLKDLVAGGVTKSQPDGLSPLAQLAEIRKVVDEQTTRVEELFLDELLPGLKAEGIELLRWSELEEAEQKQVAGVFEERIFPVLTPLAVDPGHPFPYISNLSLNVAVLVLDPETDQHRFARIKVPPSMPRFIALPDNRFVATEDAIVAHLDQLFPGMDVLGGWPFRVTRNADLTLDEDAEDLLEAVEVELRRRRFGRAIRLEITGDLDPEVRQILSDELDLDDDDDVYDHRGWLDLAALWQFQSLDRADLKTEYANGVTPLRLRDVEDSREVFDRIRRSDILLHHPYDSFNSSVTQFVRRASEDPDVLAIKITLYRTSGDSPIIESLVEAAERGKQVAALVELKARFDEEANITWARRLEDAGVHVVYGLVGLKIHTKITLVVRNEGDGIRRYCHVGTGNYNPKTARIYEDLGLLTADPAIGNDLSQLFNFLTGFGRAVSYERLLVAPATLRPALERLIANEIEAPAGTGRIVFKMNSLVDPKIIEQLYAASTAGVQVDLIIRGICCLVPGVSGVSENIRVRSLVGHYLEHSRVFYFANGGLVDEPTAAEGAKDLYYIGSADLMPRNLDRRVEALVRIDDDGAKARLHEILQMNLDDTALAWELGPDGEYHRVEGDVNAHLSLEALAAARADVPQGD